jgi:transcriptional antiterminator RfaH
MTIIVPSRWYVVQTHVHSERRAEEHLIRQGYDVYLPRYLKRRRHARRVDNVPAPLFPRYLFVGFDLETLRWRSIQSTQGVSHLICNSNEPALLPQSVITELRKREDHDGFIRLNPQPLFARGDKVRVVEGVFGDSFGFFEGMADRDRVAILLDLLGRKVRVVLDRESVAAA